MQADIVKAIQQGTEKMTVFNKPIHGFALFRKAGRSVIRWRKSGIFPENTNEVIAVAITNKIRDFLNLFICIFQIVNSFLNA